MSTVLHLAPHPDDELLGVPATLMDLRDEGWRVVNVACSLGRAEQQSRRMGEVQEACRRARFELIVPDAPFAISRKDDLALAQRGLTIFIQQLLDEFRPAVVVSPSPHDRHYGHETVARAALSALEADENPTLRWWMWGIWAGLAMPNVAVKFGERRMTEVLTAFEAYSGELSRNDYRRLLCGRSQMNASLGPEVVFGFGHPAANTKYVELFMELSWRSDQWLLGDPRWFAANSPIGSRGRVDVSDWVREKSLTMRFGPPGTVE